MFVQWATNPPSDYVQMDSADWPNTLAKPLPDGSEVIDNQPGYICAVNVQGVEFIGYDHIAVVPVPASPDIIVAAWKDDLDDLPEDEHFSRLMRFSPLTPDPRIGGALNTNQSQQILCNTTVKQRFIDLGAIENTVLGDLADFETPKSKFVRHGVWLPDELFLEHESLRTVAPWMDWADG
jgi:hypothetical protein